jgi:hypothetical protein
MVSRGRMVRALGSALTAAGAEKMDAGTVALARQYAELIDNAQPLAKYTKHLDGLRAAVAELEQLDPLAVDAREHLDKIADAISAHSVASDLGPKLLAALIALGMTPTARRAVIGGQNAVTRTGGVDELRSRRASRAERAR